MKKKVQEIDSLSIVLLLIAILLAYGVYNKMVEQPTVIYPQYGGHPVDPQF